MPFAHYWVSHIISLVTGKKTDQNLVVGTDFKTVCETKKWNMTCYII